MLWNDPHAKRQQSSTREEEKTSYATNLSSFIVDENGDGVYCVSYIGNNLSKVF